MTCAPPATDVMVDHGQRAGFAVPELLVLRTRCIKTIGLWAVAPWQNKKRDRCHRPGGLPPALRCRQGCWYYLVDESIDISLVTDLKPAACRLNCVKTDSPNLRLTERELKIA